MIKEWNILYRRKHWSEKDEYTECFIVLSSWWKVVRWFLFKARSCCELSIWVSNRVPAEEEAL